MARDKGPNQFGTLLKVWLFAAVFSF